MDLASLKSEPQLTKVTIDDKAIVKKYGEAVDFYTYDRHPMDTFTRLANLDESNPREILDVMKTLILDSEGNPIITDNYTLPTDLLTRSFQKVTDLLGK